MPLLSAGRLRALAARCALLRAHHAGLRQGARLQARQVATRCARANGAGRSVSRRRRGGALVARRWGHQHCSAPIGSKMRLSRVIMQRAGSCSRMMSRVNAHTASAAGAPPPEITRPSPVCAALLVVACPRAADEQQSEAGAAAGRCDVAWRLCNRSTARRRRGTRRKPARRHQIGPGRPALHETRGACRLPSRRRPGSQLSRPRTAATEPGRPRAFAPQKRPSDGATVVHARGAVSGAQRMRSRGQNGGRTWPPALLAQGWVLTLGCRSPRRYARSARTGYSSALALRKMWHSAFARGDAVSVRFARGCSAAARGACLSTLAPLPRAPRCRKLQPEALCSARWSRRSVARACQT